MARLGSAPATAGEAHPPGVLSRDAERSAAPRSRRRRRRRAAVADGGERRRRRRVAAADAHRAGRCRAGARDGAGVLALGPRRRGSRADRARVVAGVLAQPRAGAGIDRRAAARESGGRRDPARAVDAAGRATCRSRRSVVASAAPAPRPPGRRRSVPVQATSAVPTTPESSRPDPLVALVRAVQQIPGGRLAAQHGARRSSPYPSPKSSVAPIDVAPLDTPPIADASAEPARPRRTVMPRSFPLCLSCRRPRSASTLRPEEPPRTPPVSTARAGAIQAAPAAPTQRASESERAHRRDHPLKGDAKPLVKTLSMVAADGKRDQGAGRHRDSRARWAVASADRAADVSTTRRRRQRRRHAAASSTPRHVLAAHEAEVLDRLQAGRRTGEQPELRQGSHEVSGIVFDSGKPVVVTQAADGETGREYTVQVTATILK